MKKQDLKIETLLTVISPAQVVRILDDERAAGQGYVRDVERMTLFRGTAAKAFREYAGKGALIKHIAPEVEDDGKTGRYVMHIYIYPGK